MESIVSRADTTEDEPSASITRVCTASSACTILAMASLVVRPRSSSLSMHEHVLARKKRLTDRQGISDEVVIMITKEELITMKDGMTSGRYR